LKRLLAVLFLAAIATSAFAADVTGTWKASFDTPNGTMESTFVFKVDGSKLTGTISMGEMGDSAISEGKVDGDSISFAVVRERDGNEFRMNYKGKVSGAEIKFTVELPAIDRTIEITAKKVS
jgi:hypothetical protein